MKTVTDFWVFMEDVFLLTKLISKIPVKMNFIRN